VKLITQLQNVLVQLPILSTVCKCYCSEYSCVVTAIYTPAAIRNRCLLGEATRNTSSQPRALSKGTFSAWECWSFVIHSFTPTPCLRVGQIFEAFFWFVAICIPLSENTGRTMYTKTGFLHFILGHFRLVDSAQSCDQLHIY